jgi:gluconate 2-dehydrogenase
MSKKKVWVSRPLFPDVLAHLADHVEVTAETVEGIRTADQMRAKLADVDGAIVGLSERVDAGVLEGRGCAWHQHA